MVRLAYAGSGAICAALAVTGLVLMSVVILQFAETLPEDRRQRLKLRSLFRNYGRVLGSQPFRASPLFTHSASGACSPTSLALRPC